MRTAHLDLKVFTVAEIISYTVEAYTESSFNGGTVLDGGHVELAEAIR